MLLEMILALILIAIVYLIVEIRVSKKEILEKLAEQDSKIDKFNVDIGNIDDEVAQMRAFMGD